MILTSLEKKTQKDVAKSLAQISPEAVKRDLEKYLSDDKVQIQFTVDQGLMEKFKRLRGLLCHSTSANPNYAELFHKICDIALQKVDPLQRRERQIKRKLKSNERAQTAASLSGAAKDIASANSHEEKKTKTSIPTRYIPISIKREVWRRDRSKCSYFDSNTNRRCGSHYGLELDHIIPFSTGGKATVENLRLTCPAHNQLAAIQQFGAEKDGDSLRSCNLKNSGRVSLAKTKVIGSKRYSRY